MSERYSDGGRAFAAVLAGIAVGFNIGNVVRLAFDNSDDRVRAVQAYNRELYDQLATKDRVVLDLTLNDEEHRFVFHNEAEGACTGEYKVHADIAEVVGPLACTHTVPDPVHS